MDTLGTSDFEVAERTTLTDDIVEKLIAYVADNRLEAGDMLPSEKQLTEALGVSRLPLREALSQLRALGIIVVRQGKGAIVRDVDLSDLFRRLTPIMRTQHDMSIHDVIEARLLLEPFVAGLAAERWEGTEVDLLESCTAGMEEHVHDRSDYIRYDIRFHQILSQATGNPALQMLVRVIHDMMFVAQWRYPNEASQRIMSVEHHKRICAAIRARDVDAARRTMREHIEHVRSLPT